MNRARRSPSALVSQRVLKAGVLALLAIAQAATPAAGDLRTVALTGQPAPGTAANFLSMAVGPVVINDAGHTAFAAVLSANGEDRGIWSEGSGSLALVARSQTPAPGPPDGMEFFSLGSPLLNNAGHTAFWAWVTNLGVRESIWSEGSGVLTSVARAGSQAVGAPSGVNYIGLQSPALNDTGQTAFWAALTGSGVTTNNNVGIWSEGPGSLTLLARAGSQAPGTLGGVTFIGLGGPALNNAGHSAFFGSLAGSGVDDANRRGIWSDRSGSVALLVRGGNQAPAMPAGVNFTILSDSPALNNASHIAFRASIAGPGVDATNDQGIWSEGAGSLAPVARKGSQAPGAPGGVNFSGFEQPILNNAGHTAFLASLAGPGVGLTNDIGVWYEGPSGLALAARRGTQAPDAPSDVNFDAFSAPAFNDAGQLTFYALVTGAGVDASNDEGIWAIDRAGVLHLIARTGDQIEVAPGDPRVISHLQFAGRTGNGDGRPSGLNKAGQVAFRAVFTDGASGAFVSNLVAVPEPSAVALAALAFTAVVRARRRQF